MITRYSSYIQTITFLLITMSCPIHHTILTIRPTNLIIMNFRTLFHYLNTTIVFTNSFSRRTKASNIFIISVITVIIFSIANLYSIWMYRRITIITVISMRDIAIGLFNGIHNIIRISKTILIYILIPRRYLRLSTKRITNNSWVILTNKVFSMLDLTIFTNIPIGTLIRSIFLACFYFVITTSSLIRNITRSLSY